ncbi:GntR family transcriptional regulator [Roseibium sp. Sym1]|uniref:GntR family transcriptional regulator n=1 Tax=Roseibium sp. Sym1 TaxID=3016006 RepID=UPI0022B2BAA6|nr:GntR family transcriptional regulator [Roseibium sp. Sym1]
MSPSPSSFQIDPASGPVRDQVVDVLRRAIFAMTFEPGEKLVERRLCEMTGASRTALREGLRQLEAEGLVEIVPNRGPAIPRLNAKQVADIYEMRGVLESHMGAVAAERATGRDIAELRRIARAIDDAMAAGDRLAIIDSKRAYYDWFLRLADNAEMTATVHRLLGRMSLLWPALIAGNAVEAEAGRAEIADIVEAVAAHDPVRAAEACARHLKSAGKLVSGFLIRDA